MIKPVILCCGEALIDMIPERSGAGHQVFHPRCGGAALNTALALARLGAWAGLLSGLSRDQFGRQLVAAMDEAGVDHSLAVVSDRPTTLAFVHLGGDEATYSFYDENSALRAVTRDDLPDLPASVKCLLLGGISLCHAPGADAFEALSERANGRLVMFDPNIRPDFIGDEHAYRARLARMMARAHIVKISGDDLDWIDPRAVALRDKLDRILAAGPAVVLFTQGAKGAFARHRDGREVAVMVDPVQVNDAVGAGDAFNAGFLARLAALGHLDPQAIDRIGSDTLGDCLENAVRVAVETLKRSGTV